MSTGTPRRRPVPADLFGGRLAGCFLLDLEVVGTGEPRPGTRSITFTSPDLVGFESLPGQDVMFEVPAMPGTRRRYTIRRADPAAGTLDIEVVLHGDGPFASWAAGASVGDRIEGIGPRGVVTLHAGATHHLFVADASAVPFALAMAESVSAGTPLTVVEIVDALDDLDTIALPAGAAAYVNGERSLVRSAVELLVTRGVPPDMITSKAYWRRDEANKPHGEPSKD